VPVNLAKLLAEAPRTEEEREVGSAGRTVAVDVATSGTPRAEEAREVGRGDRAVAVEVSWAVRAAASRNAVHLDWPLVRASTEWSEDVLSSAGAERVATPDVGRETCCWDGHADTRAVASADWNASWVGAVEEVVGFEHDDHSRLVLEAERWIELDVTHVDAAWDEDVLRLDEFEVIAVASGDDWVAWIATVKVAIDHELTGDVHVWEVVAACCTSWGERTERCNTEVDAVEFLDEVRAAEGSSEHHVGRTTGAVTAAGCAALDEVASWGLCDRGRRRVRTSVRAGLIDEDWARSVDSINLEEVLREHATAGEHASVEVSTDEDVVETRREADRGAGWAGAGASCHDAHTGAVRSSDVTREDEHVDEARREDAHRDLLVGWDGDLVEVGIAGETTCAVVSDEERALDLLIEAELLDLTTSVATTVGVCAASLRLVGGLRWELARFWHVEGNARGAWEVVRTRTDQVPVAAHDWGRDVRWEDAARSCTRGVTVVVAGDERGVERVVVKRSWVRTHCVDRELRVEGRDWTTVDAAGLHAERAVGNRLEAEPNVVQEHIVARVAGVARVVWTIGVATVDVDVAEGVTGEDRGSRRAVVGNSWVCTRAVVNEDAAEFDRGINARLAPSVGAARWVEVANSRAANCIIAAAACVHFAAAAGRADAAVRNGLERKVQLASTRLRDAGSWGVTTDADVVGGTADGGDLWDLRVEGLATSEAGAVAVAGDLGQCTARTRVNDNRRVEAACEAGVDVEVAVGWGGELEPDILVCRSPAEVGVSAGRVIDRFRAGRRVCCGERVWSNDRRRGRGTLVRLGHCKTRDAGREDGGNEHARTVKILHRIAP
jgi:hypothetical protein